MKSPMLGAIAPVLLILLTLSGASLGEKRLPSSEPDLAKLQNENRVLRESNAKLRERLLATEKAYRTQSSKVAALQAEVQQARAAPKKVVVPARSPVGQPKRAPEKKSTALTHWLSSNSKVRHNSTCQWYMKSKGRKCTASEGRGCKQCGG